MLILASNSPRRRQLLDLTGLDYQVLAASVDESVRTDEPPEAYVHRLARQKAQAVATLIPPAERSQAVILAADTAVVLGSNILGKPANAVEAEIMLRRLRNRSHQVYTALCVLTPGDGACLSELVATDVTIRDYSDEEIQAYIQSGDPLDKAGAYAIQQAAFHPVQNLQGCYANVMGLPVCRLAGMLASLGIQPGNSILAACQAAFDHPCELYSNVIG
ncbi:MAG: septum formation protein Maf [Chloroflexi bacterium RBG_16_57_11]|nr:MAG: septum formation protein Maf [Chloroflexi bacterium RBG_16_57_11]